MRRRVAYSRDTLQVDRLPPTEHMELNYRPQLVPSKQILPAVGIELLAISALVFLALFVMSWAAHGIDFGAMFAAAIPFLLMILLRTVLTDLDSDLTGIREAWAFWALAVLVLVALSQLRTPAAVYFLVFGGAIAVAALVALLVAKQAAYWMTANPKVDWREARLWKSNWRQLASLETPTHCPEILTTRMMFVAVAIQFLVGYAYFAWRPSAAGELAAAGWPVLVVVFLPLPIYWFVWNYCGIVPRLPLLATFRALQRALQVWLAYLPNPQRRPGVFLLPTPALRHGRVRVALVFAAVGCLAIAIFLIERVHSVEYSTDLHATPTTRLEFMSEADWSVRGFCLAFAFSMFIPPLLFLLLFWMLAGSLLTRFWLALEAEGAYDQSQTKTPWTIAVNRILNSRIALERKHLLLGRALEGDYPVLLDRALLHQHAHLVGDSGSRKTSLGIAPTIAQLIASNDNSVVVLDLKGDRALFETARIEATEAGADFRWFTAEPGHSSHVFNPLEQSHLDRFNPSQRTQLILEALALNYGDAYGRGYFSAVNESVLVNILRKHGVRNFIQLHQLLTDAKIYETLKLLDEPKDARHLSSLVDRLISVPHLNLTHAQLAGRPAVAAAAIDMPSLLARPQVVYFNLRSSHNPIVSPAIAKLALYLLFTAAADRTPDQKCHVYVVVDEFQQIVSENIPLVMEQARSSGLAFLIAHQSLDQLDRKKVDIRDTIQACTAFKQYFRASDPKTIRHLEELSGEGLFENLEWTQSIDAALGVDHDHSFSPLKAVDGAVKVTESREPLLERNTILNVSSLPNTSFVHFTEGSNFTQFGAFPTPIISDYHINEDEYDKRREASWPPADERTIIVEQPPRPTPFPDADSDDVVSALDELARDIATADSEPRPIVGPQSPSTAHSSDRERYHE